MSHSDRHAIRKLQRRVQRLEDKQRRDMARLKQELVGVILHDDGGRLIPDALLPIFEQRIRGER